MKIDFFNVFTPVPPRLIDTGDTGGGHGTPTNTPIWAYEYEFSSSSMGKNGTFIRLADANQPKVRVGSILGNKGASHTTVAGSFLGRGTLDRKVVITPKASLCGRNEYEVHD